LYLKNTVQLHAYVVAHLNIVHIFCKIKGLWSCHQWHLWSKIKNMHNLPYFT